MFLVGTNLGDVVLWEVGSKRKTGKKKKREGDPFKV
jgi:hypothetical protein